MFCFSDPPTPPGQPEIADYDKDFVTLKWKKPANDGGTPVTGYVIEKKDKYKYVIIHSAAIHLKA